MVKNISDRNKRKERGVDKIMKNMSDGNENKNKS